MSNFLELPLEIRNDIYETFLGYTRDDHLRLLLACRQIYQEARGSFFKRPLCCQSQCQLILFTQRYSQPLLDKVNTLMVKFDDLRPEIMHPYLARVALSLETKREENPYFVEAQRIITALQKLPNITTLCILAGTSPPKSRPPAAFVNKVLDWVRRCYSNLSRLRLDIEDYSLDDFGSLRSLRSIRTTGFSRSTPEATLSVLRKLPNLKDLSIVGPGPIHQFQNSTMLSFTPSVFASLPPLQSLTIAELNQPSRHSQDPTFLTFKTLKAIHSAHLTTLRHLKISSTTSPQPVFLAFLTALLLSSTNLQHLTLTWPNMDVKLLDCVPATVQSLEVVVTGPSYAGKLEKKLRKARRWLSEVKSVTFVVVNTPAFVLSHDADKKDEMDVCTGEGSADDREVGASSSHPRVVMPLKSTPWTISWGVWQPFADE